jgi:hypothetical protein
MKSQIKFSSPKAGERCRVKAAENPSLGMGEELRVKGKYTPELSVKSGELAYPIANEQIHLFVASLD